MMQLLERLPLRPSRGAACSGRALRSHSMYEDRANVGPSHARALETPLTPTADAKSPLAHNPCPHKIDGDARSECQRADDTA